MTAITFVATTAEGNTVIRTSATKDYNFVVLAKNQIAGPARANDDVEGAWGWSGDKANAEKTAQTARKAYRSVRVVPVEQKLTGREATLVREAAKAGVTTTPAVEATNTKEETVATATTKPARKRAARSSAPKVVTPLPVIAEPIEPAYDELDAQVEEAAAKERMAALATAEFEAVLADLAAAQEKVANLLARRNGMIDNLITQQVVSGPKLAKVMGVTPMAVYNMRAKATA